MLVAASLYFALHLDPTFDKYTWSLGVGFGLSLGMAYHDGRVAVEEQINGQE